MNQKLIDSVAKEVINGINITKYDKNRLLFVCGPMGSGKTTFIHNKLMDEKAYYSSIDELIDRFTYLENDPRELYKLCRQVGIIVTDYLLENNVSMIIEGTGVNMDTIEYFQRLKKAGYMINTYFLKTDLEVCRSRVKSRNQTQTHQVLDEDIISYYNILWKGTKDKPKMENLIVKLSNIVSYVFNYENTKRNFTLTF